MYIGPSLHELLFNINFYEKNLVNVNKRASNKLYNVTETNFIISFILY